jgi:predicted protein tyrosine phosphatase
MRELAKNLYVGSDKDVEKARGRGFSIVHACKDGEYSHRSVLNYTSMGAPRGSEYLVAKRNRELYLNLIDTSDPAFVPDGVIDPALDFIQEQRDDGRSVLVHCNHGISRSPTLILLYLYKTGKLPRETHKALRLFRQLYPDYDPATGLALYAKRKIQEFKAKRHG